MRVDILSEAHIIAMAYENQLWKCTLCEAGRLHGVASCVVVQSAPT